MKARTVLCVVWTILLLASCAQPPALPPSSPQQPTLTLQPSPSLQLKNPIGICLDADGRIYVADTNHDRIVRMDDITGRKWTTWP